MPGKTTEKGGKVEALVLEIRKRKGESDSDSAEVPWGAPSADHSSCAPSGLKPDIPTLDQFYDKL